MLIPPVKPFMELGVKPALTATAGPGPPDSAATQRLDARTDGLVTAPFGRATYGLDP